MEAVIPWQPYDSPWGDQTADHVPVLYIHTCHAGGHMHALHGPKWVNLHHMSTYTVS